MNSGRIVIIGMGVCAAAWIAGGLLWPEGKDAAPAPPPAEPKAADEDRALRITERKTDGSLVITNAPTEGSRLQASLDRRAAQEAREAAEAAPPEGNPFQAFIDDGSPLTADAMRGPDMTNMDPGHADYDPAVDARQRFNGIERDLLAAMPLDPAKWKKITSAHQDDLKGVFTRARILTEQDRAEEARLLIEEWGELQGKYQAQAYGRSPQPSTIEQ